MAPEPSRRPVPRVLIWLAVPVVAAGLAFAWWTISPLFINTRVDEAFPVSALATTEPEAPTAAPSVASSAPAATAAPSVVATSEAAPTAVATTAEPPPPSATSRPAVAVVAQPKPSATPVPPVALASGTFTQIDALHGASGVATVYRLPAGEFVLRLENFDAQNGPDLRVGLSGHPMPRSNAELNDQGYVELAVLKANQGNQNYQLPAGLDPEVFRSVVIYCKAFSVVFSTAELAQS